MSAHASQAFSIAHCTNWEDLPSIATGEVSGLKNGEPVMEAGVGLLV